MQENKLIDSNIIVYAFDKSEKDKHENARVLLYSCLDKKERFFISFQNISEFYSAVTTKIEKPLQLEEARRICKLIIEFAGFIKIAPSTNAMINAMELNEKSKIPYWDALIVSTMLENNVLTIYTENVKHFERVPALKVINPFK